MFSEIWIIWNAYSGPFSPIKCKNVKTKTTVNTTFTVFITTYKFKKKSVNEFSKASLNSPKKTINMLQNITKQTSRCTRIQLVHGSCCHVFFIKHCQKKFFRINLAFNRCRVVKKQQLQNFTLYQSHNAAITAAMQVIIIIIIIIITIIIMIVDVTMWSLPWYLHPHNPEDQMLSFQHLF